MDLRRAAGPAGSLGRAPFVMAFTLGVLAALFGIATGRLSLAAGVFLTSLLSILYLARPETALQLMVLYWPFHEILYLFSEGELLALWADITLAVFTLLWMSQSWIRKEPLLPRSGVTWAILAFLGVLLLGLVRSPNPVAGVLGFKWWAMHVPLYFLAARTRLDGRRAISLVVALVVACALKGFFHIAQLYVGGPYFPSSFPVGGEGLEAHSSYVCLYALIVIMGWAMWPYPATRAGRLALNVGLLFTLAIIGVSLLRVAWIATIAGTAIVLLVARDMPIKRTMLLVCLCAAAWIVSPEAWRDRLLVTFQPSQTAAMRSAGYSATVKAQTIGRYVSRHLSADGSAALQDQGVWGSGLGTVSSADAAKWIGDYALSVSVPESMFADAFIELGWLGLFAYLAIQACLIGEAYRLTRVLRDARLRAFAAGICGCGVATLLADLGTEFSCAASTYYWYLAGLLLALRQTAAAQGVGLPSRVSRLASRVSRLASGAFGQSQHSTPNTEHPTPDTHPYGRHKR